MMVNLRSARRCLRCRLCVFLMGWTVNVLSLRLLCGIRRMMSIWLLVCRRCLLLVLGEARWTR